MSFLDKALIFISCTTLSLIFIILVTGELNSTSAFREISSFDVNSKANPKPNNSQQGYIVNNTTTIKRNSFDEENVVVVIDHEIDKILEEYFENIKKNPAQEEEVTRLISTDSDGDLEVKIPDQLESTITQTSTAISNNVDSQQLKTKKEEKPQAPPKPITQLTVHSHIVQEGESLWRIARKYNIPMYTVLSANPNKKRKIIRPGEEIKVPNKPGVFYTVIYGDTLSGVSRKFNVGIASIKEYNQLSQKYLKKGKKLFIPNGKPLANTVTAKVIKSQFKWPLYGRLTSHFGWRTHPIHKVRHFHSGLDIAAKANTSILASSSGVVIFSGYRSGYGNVVILRHKNNMYTVYGHCSSLLVKVGEYVKQRQPIARVGRSGNSTGYHLHFEIKRKSKALNPYILLDKTERKQQQKMARQLAYQQ